MYCRQCGARNDENAWKCVQCGTEVHPAPAEPAGQPVVISNYLWQSIVCTLLCCWPLGIPAIVYAAQVNTKVGRGDIEGARQASKNAKMWCWIALGGGLLVATVYILLVVLGLIYSLYP